MEKIIWVIGNNRSEMIDIQRKINAAGSMRAVCMLSFDALQFTVTQRLMESNGGEVFPSLIVVDYDLCKAEEKVLQCIRDEKMLSGVPLFFICSEKSTAVEDECYQQGALVVLEKPLPVQGITRMERAAWQYENTKQYERFLQEQATELRMAKEILTLNQQLEHRNEFLHKVFGKYFSDDVLEIILNQPDGDAIGGVRKNVVVLGSDLRGFTSIAEDMDPGSMTDMLNEYFGRMTEIIMKYGGTVIEFMGDGILSVFGVLSDGQDYRLNAMAAAISMQNAMGEINAYCANKGYPLLEMGIGIHCGEAFVGNVGSEKMMRYNVLGSIVNECSRIESYSVGGQVLISQDMMNGLEEALDVSNQMKLTAKGIKKPLDICDLEGVQCQNEHLMLYNRQKDDMRSVVEHVVFCMHRITNKVVAEEFAEYDLEEISSSEAKLYHCDNEYLQQYDDISIVAKADDGRVLFEQVYAKVVECDTESVRIHFTHLNHSFKKFMKSTFIAKGENSAE